MDLVKNIQAIESARRVECQGCMTLVPHVDPDCMLCDACLEEGDREFMEDVERRSVDDLSDDGEALASAGWGTDEDYYCGTDEDY